MSGEHTAHGCPDAHHNGHLHHRGGPGDPQRHLLSVHEGDSDKSGILKIFLENLTAQLKIIQFYKIKKTINSGTY
jgi:hypothetical protein